MSATRKIDVLFLYEHASRELDVACAVASHLRTRYGVSIEIAQSSYGLHWAMAGLTPRVVVLPFCYQERSHDSCLVQWRDAIYFNMSWEQLFYKGNSIVKSPRGAFAIRHVIHHAWSDYFARLLVGHGVPEQHIFTNGQPAYTLYDEPYRAYFETREILARRNGLRPEKRWIFFPENYNWAFYSNATIKSFIDNGQSQSDVSEMKDYCERSMGEVMRWLNSASSSGSAEYIVRPRPATPIEDFTRAVRNIIPNLSEHVHIMQDASVREWILASDVTISSHSTSLIEAAVAGKQCYMLEPYPIPAALAVTWHDKVARIRSLDEFQRISTRGDAEGDNAAIRQWARSTLMARGDAIANIAEYLAALCSGRAARPDIPEIRDITPRWRLTWLPIPSRLLYEYRRILGRKRRCNPRPIIEPEYVKDLVSRNEIERRITKWDMILSGYGGNIR